ncbi:DUF4870 family protein [Massilia antarctica]|uniref:DUF4870 family protein n=1 Tax=Massilia antarctica TaxID=2765360 RepID=UPI0006BB7D1E|nr:hypothetical protein [Massilia sp. H27-R4]MCY0910387.1 hypothetical protein [Massilia sp. H27-R4]CUI09268.1 Probable transmembrane protein [Janthinobacterium sp. CG23_2]CUU33054.1 Probable transmembrane protein [Janthinobacterium sp. CG23_2]
MTQELTLDSNLEDQKNMVRILYIVHALALVFSLGLLSVVPLIANYIKRPETEGTYLYSHHSWMIRSFWWFFVWAMVAAFFWIALWWVFGLGIFIAWVVGGLAWIWKAYRLLRGFFDLENNKAMPG